MSQGIHIDAKSDAELHIWPAADTPTQRALHQEEGLQLHIKVPMNATGEGLRIAQGHPGAENTSEE